MKGKFHLVNWALVIVLILFTIFHYATEHGNNIEISSYNDEIQVQQNAIDKLVVINKEVDNNLETLSDSIVQLKELAIQHEDSIIYINVKHGEAIAQIRVLSDSLSVIKFRESTSKHGSRFGYDFN